MFGKCRYLIGRGFDGFKSGVREVVGIVEKSGVQIEGIWIKPAPYDFEGIGLKQLRREIMEI